MQKLDKKQMPQFVGLCVLSTGVFGYFGVRMVTPSPAAAATRPAPKPMVPATLSAAAPAAARAAAAAAPADNAAAIVPPPAPGMRDPFVVGYIDPKSVKAAPAAFTAPVPGPAPAAGTPVADAQIHEQVASLPPAPVSGLIVPGFPAAPPLPSAAPALPPSQKIMPLPAPPPAPPKWTVTGLLQSETGGVAILRDGDSRRFVRVGDFVDGVFRVANVTRSSVVLRHGKTFYTLPLSTAAAKPEVKPEAKPETKLEAAPAPAAPAPPAPMLPQQSLAAPGPARRLTAAALPPALPLRLLDGTEMAAGAPAQIASRLR